MGYLSCRADSSIATCRSISSVTVAPARTAKSRKKKPTINPKSCSKSMVGGEIEEEAEEEENDGIAHPDRHIRRFTYRELETATGNFSDSALLGRGSHGAVYKAVLPSTGGRPVAVKRPSATRTEVDNEIRILSRLHRSPRLVNLIGFTPTTDNGNKDRLLVVEFMPNGTLFDLLHSNPHGPPLWPRRLRLALQTAKALHTLHSSHPPVIHRDVKSANVLIDRRLHARLADFGLALIDDDDDNTLNFPSSARSTPPAGTLGYLDPSYVTPENLSTKTDVFSFGILLLEIISGRKAIDVAHSPPSVVEWAVPLIKKGKVLQVFDPRLAPPKSSAARRQLVLLAASCVRSCRERRPAMGDVVEQLKELTRMVPSRAWNGLSVVVGNPCSVVETERTVSKMNPNGLKNPVTRVAAVEESGSTEDFVMLGVGVKKASSSSSTTSSKAVVRPLRNGRRVFSDASTRGSRNLMDLMGRPDGEADERGMSVGGNVGSHRFVISRARTVHFTRDYYDRNGGMLRLRRNRTVTGDGLEVFSRSNGLENLDSKPGGGQGRDDL